MLIDSKIITDYLQNRISSLSENKADQEDKQQFNFTWGRIEECSYILNWILKLIKDEEEK